MSYLLLLNNCWLAARVSQPLNKQSSPPAPVERHRQRACKQDRILKPQFIRAQLLQKHTHKYKRITASLPAGDPPPTHTHTHTQNSSSSFSPLDISPSLQRHLSWPRILFAPLYTVVGVQASKQVIQAGNACAFHRLSNSILACTPSLQTDTQPSWSLTARRASTFATGLHSRESASCPFTTDVLLSCLNATWGENRPRIVGIGG